MMISRRRLLIGMGTTLLAKPFLALESAALAATPEAPGWDALRKEFLLDPGKIHLAQLLLASQHKSVREAVEGYRRKLDRNPDECLHDYATEYEDPVRKAAAAYMGVSFEEIALTDSTTMGVGLMYGGVKLEPGVEIVTTTHDHKVTYDAIRIHAERNEVKFRKVPLYESSAVATDDEILTKVTGALTDSTRVLALTWVHSGTGVRLPLGKISAAVESLNKRRAEKDKVLIFVDGAHGFGVENVTMKDLGCDFFAAGCHKWIFGPRGTGVLWGRAAVASKVSPSLPHFFPPITWGRAMTPGGFHTFENRWALDKAFVLHQRWGKAAVADRIHSLNRQLKLGLKEIRGVKVHTPMDDSLSSGITCFEVAGHEPKVVVEKLAKKKIIASTTPPFYTPTLVRFTPGILNTPEEIRKAVAAVAALAV